MSVSFFSDVSKFGAFKIRTYAAGSSIILSGSKIMHMQHRLSLLLVPRHFAPNPFPPLDTVQPS